MTGPKPKTWGCKIGEVHPEMLAPGADAPMREAVARAYVALTGQTPVFIFSGWGDELTEPERAAHENRQPSEEWERELRARENALELLDVLRCVQAAIVGEVNGIPNDLKAQLERATAVITKAEGK